MNCNEYQNWTIETAIYPGAGKGGLDELCYLALGLSSEAGEVAGKIKKLQRDGSLDTAGTIHEVADCCWYIARLAESLGFTFEDLLRINHAKLTKRKSAGTLSGSGDKR